MPKPPSSFIKKFLEMSDKSQTLSVGMANSFRKMRSSAVVSQPVVNNTKKLAKAAEAARVLEAPPVVNIGSVNGRNISATGTMVADSVEEATATARAVSEMFDGGGFVVNATSGAKAEQVINRTVR